MYMLSLVILLYRALGPCVLGVGELPLEQMFCIE